MGGDEFAFSTYVVAPLRQGLDYTPRAAERDALMRTLAAAPGTRQGPLRLFALANHANTRWEDIRPTLLLHDVVWVMGVQLVPRPGRGGLGVNVGAIADAMADVTAALSSAALAEWADPAAVSVWAATDLRDRFRFVDDEDLPDC